MNVVMMRGNVGQDPEVRETRGGKLVANIRLAMSQKFVDGEGEERERTDWVTVVAWGGLAELVRDRVNSGTELFVRGELRARSWETDDGAKRTVLEVNAAELGVIAGRPRGDNQQRNRGGGSGRQRGSTGRDDGGRQRGQGSHGDDW